MSYRVLAYGGTSYSERVRVGTWDVESGVLDAREGLHNSESFGLGALGSDAHLIFRALQNVESRGGYPYTLLFDAGREVWRGFGWNAAALLRVLQRYERLFTEPDAFAFDSMTLDPPGIEPDHEPSRLRVLLAGCVTSESSLVVHPRDVGFSTRPSPEELCRVLAFDAQRSGAPCCSFTGLGWLVGGGSGLAGGLGARLVIDEDSDTDAAAVAAHERAGQRFLDAWQTVDRWDPGVLSRLQRQPPWEWAAPPRQIASRIGWLAAILTPSVAESVFDEIEIPLDGGPIVDQLRSVAREAAQSGGGALSAERAKFLLDDSIRFREALGAELIERMPKEIVVSTLASSCEAPDQLPVSIELPTPMAVELWRRSLARAREVNRVGLLARAADHLRGRRDIAASDYQTLVEAGIADTLDLRSLDLARVRSDRKFRAAIKKRLAPRVRRTISAPDFVSHVEEQFLYLDDDEVVQEVNRSPNAMERATEIVNNWFLHFRNHPEAAERFDRLATSPLRGLLTTHVKLQVAQANEEVESHSGPWSDYLYMDRLYNGGDALDSKPVVGDTEEKGRLHVELRQLFESEQPMQTPNLIALAQFLEPLPKPVRDHVGHRANQPDPNAPGFDRWQKGLDFLGLDEARGGNTLGRIVAQLTRRGTSGGDVSARPETRLAQVEHEEQPALNARWRALLFSPQLDETDLTTLDAFLQVAHSVPEFASFVETALSAAPPSQQRTFAERFMAPDRLGRLLSVVADEALQDRIVDLIARDRARFREPHQSRLMEALRRVRVGETCGPVDKALARFLQRNPEEMSDWAKTLYGNVNDFQRALNHLVTLPTDGSDRQP